MPPHAFTELPASRKVVPTTTHINVDFIAAILQDKEKKKNYIKIEWMERRSTFLQEWDVINLFVFSADLAGVRMRYFAFCLYVCEVCVCVCADYILMMTIMKEM